jgi:hypothetical protein
MSSLYDIGSEIGETVSRAYQQRFMLVLLNRRFTKFGFEIKRPLLRTNNVLKYSSECLRSRTSDSSRKGKGRRCTENDYRCGF